jgi:hypothetical protein
VAKSPGGKSAGRVSIRVLPDTSDFRDELVKKLRTIARTTTLAITVDRVNLDAAKIRASVKEQFDKLDNVEVDANVRAVVDKVTVRKVEVRRSLQQQFDEMGLVVKVGIDLTEAKKDIEQFVHDTNGKKAVINVNAATAAATAQMRWLSRDRFVDIIPRVSKVALARVTAQLGALTGLRKSFEWLDDISQWIEDLDRKLPRLGVAVTGITTLFGLIFASLSGLISLGAGIAAMVPALLVLPGLILGTAISVGILAVALGDAKEQLNDLSPAMTELKGIIRDNFWAGARQPIIDLITNLMPQLRTTFRDTSAAIGGFIGDMADSFQREFAGGRFEAAFAGLPETFRILSTGTDGFAGAIVSLGIVASQYVPRLAQWFVDLADRFDNFLKRSAEDGSLNKWIDDAIVAMNDFWRATKAAYGVLRNLWLAAERAGRKGMAGVAEGFERMERATASPKFQAALTALFRGGDAATVGLFNGLKRVGDLLHDLRVDLEYFIGTAGEAFGDLLGDIADSLNTSEFGDSLRAFIDGIDGMFDGFAQYLPSIASAAAVLLTFAGVFAETLGPILGSAADALGRTLTPILNTLNDGTLQSLGDSIKDALDRLGPKLEDVADELAPLIDSVIRLAEDVIPGLLDAVGAIADNASDPNGYLNNLIGLYTLGLDTLGKLDWLWNDESWDFLHERLLNGTYGLWLQNLTATLDQAEIDWGIWADEMNAGMDAWFLEVDTAWRDFWNGIAEWWDTFWFDLWQPVANWREDVRESLDQMWEDIEVWFFELKQGVAEWWDGVWSGLVQWVDDLDIPGGIADLFEDAATWLLDVGKDLIAGLVKGINKALPNLSTILANIGSMVPAVLKTVLGIASPARALVPIGENAVAGIGRGLDNKQSWLERKLTALVAVPSTPSPALLSPDLLAGAGGGGSTFNANFSLTPDPGIPFAEQVFQAAQRLKARTS